MEKINEMPCNCDPGDAYGHYFWCDTYRPAGTTQAQWEEGLKVHPILRANAE